MIYLGNNKTVCPVLIFTLSYILNIISDNSLWIFEGGMSWKVSHFLVRAKLKFELSVFSHFCDAWNSKRHSVKGKRNFDRFLDIF